MKIEEGNIFWNSNSSHFEVDTNRETQEKTLRMVINFSSKNKWWTLSRQINNFTDWFYSLELKYICKLFGMFQKGYIHNPWNQLINRSLTLEKWTFPKWLCLTVRIYQVKMCPTIIFLAWRLLWENGKSCQSLCCYYYTLLL